MWVGDSLAAGQPHFFQPTFLSSGTHWHRMWLQPGMQLGWKHRQGISRSSPGSKGSERLARLVWLREFGRCGHLPGTDCPEMPAHGHVSRLMLLGVDGGGGGEAGMGRAVGTPSSAPSLGWGRGLMQKEQDLHRLQSKPGRASSRARLEQVLGCQTALVSHEVPPVPATDAPCSCCLARLPKPAFAPLSFFVWQWPASVAQSSPEGSFGGGTEGA